MLGYLSGASHELDKLTCLFIQRAYVFDEIFLEIVSIKNLMG